MLTAGIIHELVFNIALLFILLDCVTNESSLDLKGCHVPLTAFYRPGKGLNMKLHFLIKLGQSRGMAHTIHYIFQNSFNESEMYSREVGQWTDFSKVSLCWAGLTDQSGPPMDYCEVKLNRNGPFHLTSDQNLYNQWYNGKHPKSLSISLCSQMVNNVFSKQTFYKTALYTVVKSTNKMRGNLKSWTPSPQTPTTDQVHGVPMDSSTDCPYRFGLYRTDHPQNKIEKH